MTTLSSEALQSGRALRQRDLVPPDRLARCHGLVIGVGAIGRQVALQLTALGMPRLTLFDDDTVELENLAPQGYAPSDLHQPKVVASARLCRHLNPEVQTATFPVRFKRSTARSLPTDLPLIVFVCVDSIQGRRLIWESVCQQAALLIDGRMNAEVLRVLTVATPKADTSYEGTLFAQAEAHAGACTAKATIYTASIAAGLMVGQFSQWLRKLPVEPDLTLNLLAMELTVSGTSGGKVLSVA